MFAATGMVRRKSPQTDYFVGMRRLFMGIATLGIDLSKTIIYVI